MSQPRVAQSESHSLRLTATNVCHSFRLMDINSSTAFQHPTALPAKQLKRRVTMKCAAAASKEQGQTVRNQYFSLRRMIGRGRRKILVSPLFAMREGAANRARLPACFRFHHMSSSQRSPPRKHDGKTRNRALGVMAHFNRRNYLPGNKTA